MIDEPITEMRVKLPPEIRDPAGNTKLKIGAAVSPVVMVTPEPMDISTSTLTTDENTKGAVVAEPTVVPASEANTFNLVSVACME